MTIDKRVAPLLLIVGATASTSYLDVDDDALTVRLGVFRYRFRRQDVVSAKRINVDWTWGIGIHTNVSSTLIINGSLDKTVELRFEPAPRAWVTVLPVTVKRLILSPADPDGFLAAIGAPTSVA